MIGVSGPWSPSHLPVSWPAARMFPASSVQEASPSWLGVRRWSSGDPISPTVLERGTRKSRASMSARFSAPPTHPSGAWDGPRYESAGAPIDTGVRPVPIAVRPNRRSTVSRRAGVRCCAPCVDLYSGWRGDGERCTIAVIAPDRPLDGRRQQGAQRLPCTPSTAAFNIPWHGERREGCESSGRARTTDRSGQPTPRQVTGRSLRGQARRRATGQASLVCR
jgi:hypothetical protein